MEFWAGRNQENGKKNQSILDDYTQKPNISNSLKDIYLNGVIWKFNRKTDIMSVNGLPFGNVEKGELSAKKIIYAIDKPHEKLILFSFEEIYRFSNKQIFHIEIGLR